MIIRAALYVQALLLAVACAEEGEGTVTVSAYGESFIEDGIPSDAFNDGWSVDFDKFIVEIDNVQVADTAIEVDDRIDLSKSSSGDGHELGSALVPVGSYKHGAFTIKKVQVQGRATKGEANKTFDWILEQATHYDECETTTKVSEGEDTTFQITVHADHLFYDSLVSEEPNVVFQALADADENDDGEITRQELSATDIGDYDPGSEDGTDDLWAWLTAQTRTLGHIDGEGHCHAESVK